ncbi:MAG: DUF3127 domain-containing protein [Bacteroidia bacterium]
MALDITGKIIQIMNETTGTSKTGNAWTKQEFVIETYDKFPRKVMMSVMGDKVQELKKFKVGDEVKASLNIESREWNSKWYTDVRAWRIEPGTQGGQQPANNPQDNFYPDAEPTPAADAVSDDLPF